MRLSKRALAEFIGTFWFALISVPVTNTSVKPPCSTGPAHSVGGWAVRQLCLLWLAPLAGAGSAAPVYRALAGDGSRR
jgi:glycerol uptake facilitator-like aquaporin